MAFFYIEPEKTNLMDVAWVKQIREDNKETHKPRKLYQHGETCLYGSDPTSIVQGRGLNGIYWKRCDGRYLNVFGEELERHLAQEAESIGTLPDNKLELEYNETKLAELAWRSRNPDNSDDEEEEKPKRKFHCIVM